jgi:cell division septal protein FtsQ
MTPTSTWSRPAPSGPPPPRTGIDPRISARRTEVTRQQGRRRLRIVGALAAVVVLLFGLWSLLHSSLFSARVVTVVGATHETTAQIDAATGLDHHPPLLDFNSGAAVRRLEQLPWVRTASVTSHWPDGVSVVVAEQVPGLVMSTPSGRWAELSKSGRVLAVVAARPPGLIEMTGPGAPGAPGSTVGEADQLGLRVAATLPMSFRAQVTEVTVESGGWVQLAMTTPILVDLGNDTQLTDKYEDVSAYLAHATLHDGDVIDVSVPGAPTVTGG